MKQLTLLTMAFLAFATAAFATDGEYAVSKIPAALLKNAHAVKRLEELRFEMTDIGRASIYKRKVITILDEKGDDFAEMVEGYDKFSSVRSFNGKLYDAAGNKIKSLKNSDIKDLSATDEGSLAEDVRVKVHDFYYKVYPYTVEYEIEVDQKETMFFPKWIPVHSEHYAVEQSIFTIITPKDYQLRYQAFNFDGKPVVNENGDQKQYHWELKNLPAFESEFASPPMEEIEPMLLTGPTQFSIQGYQGSMTDWASFGKFVYQLKAGRDQLPATIKEDVHRITATAQSEVEKIKLLYEYMQKNTRYISIQLGIGGWQPFDANYVATKRYGDCKALSNYMYSLLKEAGIPSYYTLVRAGEDEEDIITSFACHQFNHAILCVPQPKDTIWLECTSQTESPGYMGSFTGNRHALLITEDGGKLVWTPRYGKQENTQVRKIKAIINKEGDMNAEVLTRYCAEQQDNIHGLINHLSKEKVMEFLQHKIDLPNYNVVKFDYKEEKNRIPAVWETLQLTGPNYASVSGKRLFIAPNILSRNHRRLSTDSVRKYDVDLSIAYIDIDSVDITVPGGYQPESVPQNVQITSPFGNYRCDIEVSGNKIIYHRRMERNNGRFPAKSYEELVKFYEQIYKADHSRVVLVKA